MKPAPRARQGGMIGLVLVALLLLGGVMFAFSSLNVASVRVDRELSTNQALAQAKDALIAYAASHVQDVPVAGAPARPGQLPCPDVNDDGAEDYDAAAHVCLNLIGRLPWVTLGLPDLRDDAGERLWYAVSNDFRSDRVAPPAVPLNSDTAYRTGNASLALTGTTPAANLAALVIAPGATLTRSDGRVQARACGTACDARDFLDIASGEDNADATNRIFVGAPRSSNFNDTLLPVFADDIMRLVERRAARELALHLRDHYNAWGALAGVSGYTNFRGFYPFAVPWGDPSAPPQTGTNNTTRGLLPLASTPLVWSNASPSCSGNGTQTLDCSSLVLCIIVCLTNFSGRIANVPTRFVEPPGPASVQVLGVSLAGSPSWTLQQVQGRLEFSYNGGVLAIGTARIVVTAPVASSWTTGWLTQNNWHQNASYVFADGYAIDGANACGGAAPSCLTVLNTVAPNNDKRTVVAMSGRSLPSAGQTPRPVSTPASLGEFFEGLNADVNFAVFEARARAATFNDTLMFVNTSGVVGP